MIQFLYFDLGNVLANFSVERLLRQVADAAGVDAERVREVVFDAGLQTDFETGRVTSQQFYEHFCRETGTRPDYQTLEVAASDIFELNVPIVPVLAGLAQSGRPMGILSNTCETHWEHCFRQFAILPSLFDTYALSYRIGAMKPDAAIFLAAAELADCRPDEIFYLDDLPQHIEGAKAVGFDAVQYVGAPQLRADLRRRGLLGG